MGMAEDMGRAVEDGMKLSRRLFFGNDRSVSPPKRMTMHASPQSYIPTAPMVYAVIVDPAMVDNPDIPSYQPHVHGRCDRPALIPLYMNHISLEIDVVFDTAFVRICGSWRLHCVTASRFCDCRLAIPMGEQGSILGVEVDLPGSSYFTRLDAMEETDQTEKVPLLDGCGFIDGTIFTLTIPEVVGGTYLSIKASWCQKLLYSSDSRFSLKIPFSFPDYVIPAGNKISKKERILLNINLGISSEVICDEASHPVKETRREAGMLSYMYESEVQTWSIANFDFSYFVSTRTISGGVFLSPPSTHDIDKRNMFSLYILPGEGLDKKVFQKQIVFIIDISWSMQGKPLETTKNTLQDAISKLDKKDTFNIITFSDEDNMFSSEMELASPDAIERATNWIDLNFIAGGGTNIYLPLNKAMDMFSHRSSSIPVIFLVTDGAVENEKNICHAIRCRIEDEGSLHPRIYTFGIGSICNHYFLQMLASISRGYYDAAYNDDSLEFRMQRLLDKAYSLVFTTIQIENIERVKEVELYPRYIPDLLCQSPVAVSGRYVGNFPDVLKVSGFLSDLQKFEVELKVKKDDHIPLDRMFAKQQIDFFTGEAWLTGNREFSEKAARTSIRTGVLSEYTTMVLVESILPKKGKGSKRQREVRLRSMGMGFGNLRATAANVGPWSAEGEAEGAAEALARMACGCCGRMCRYCCCSCYMNLCSALNNQCVDVMAQICSALAFLACFECCSAICCSGNDS